MRAALCVFSGTGNTERVARAFLSEWTALGHEAEYFPVRADSEIPSLDGFDCLVVGYPVHAFNAPAALLKWLKSLPKGDRKNPRPAYLLRTSGEPLKLNNASGITPRRILKKKGYRVLGEFHYVMPYNIIFRHPDEMAARMWADAKRVLPDAARTASELKENRVRVNVLRRVIAFMLRIEHTAMPFIGRRFKAAKNACIGCGVCANLCPQGNITMKDGKPKFGKNCVGCMACSFGCPKDAVRISVLNGWRVNGQYDFDATPAKDGEVCRYCQKAYLRYFHEIETMENSDESIAN